MDPFQKLILVLALAFCAPRANAGSFTFPDLVRLLEDPNRKIRTVDELLAQPELSPSFRAGFTAVFESRSLQPADPLDPRIILYGEDARLILAFTCAPGDCGKVRGTEKLEVIRYLDGENRFEFHEIDFTSAKAEISPPNPRRCMGCHEGPDPRPNWESYPLWPGVYGGDSDFLFGRHPKNESPAALAKFLSTATRRPRYRRLHELVEGYSMRDDRHRKQHNIDFTQAITDLNVPRIASRLRALPFYRELKHAYGLALGGIEDLASQIERAGFDSDPWKQCLRPSFPTGEFPRFPSELAEVIRASYALGATSLPWFTAFRPKLRSEITGPNTDVDAQFLAELQRLDPELNPVLPLEIRKKKAEDGWKAVFSRPSYRESLDKCIRESRRESAPAGI